MAAKSQSSIVTSSAPLVRYTKLKPPSIPSISRTRTISKSRESLDLSETSQLPNTFTLPSYSKIICCPLVIVLILIGVAVFEIYVADSESKPWKSVFLALPDASVCRKHSQMFTDRAHLAATADNYYYAELIRDTLQSFGINATIHNHTNDLYSRYNTSSLALVHSDGRIKEQLVLSEAIIYEDDATNTPFREQAYFGYASTGNVTGNLIYVNYASRHDFESLLSLNYTLNGTIGLCRYGGSMYRGTKVYWAQYFGLQGLIIYSDPEEYGKGRNVFPWNTALPSTGFQRGSIIDGTCPGDLSPQRAKRLCNKTLAETVPQIPAIPLSYGNALKLFQHLNGVDVTTISVLNESWKGALDITYHIGGNDATVVNLVVNNTLVNSTTSNVIGFIPGYKYTNESILIGNHRDAWIYGAADPISGTTVLLEIARSFGEMHNNGWKPARNIYFGSWDGEEYNLIGSTDFTERHEHLVRNELVTYMNVDVGVAGFDLHLNGDPLLNHWLIKTATEIEQPYSNVTMFEAWKATQNVPLNIGVLGDGSDYVSFVHHFGIASADVSFTGMNDCYHSVYDSFKWMTLLDPDFELAKGMSLYAGLLALDLVTNDILPFNVTYLAERMRDWLRVNISKLGVDVNCDYKEINPTALAILEKSIENLRREAVRLDLIMKSLDVRETHEVILLNQMLRTLPSKFLYEPGLPTRKYFKNVLVAPNLDSGYDAVVFPYLSYALKFTCNARSILDAFYITASVIDLAMDHVEQFNFQYAIDINDTSLLNNMNNEMSSYS
eukprot:324671_1